MKVLFVSRIYPNENNKRNGAVIHRQALELKNKGVDVRVLSPVPYVPKLIKGMRKKWMEYYLLPNDYVFEGIRVYHTRFLDFPFNKYDSLVYKSIIKSTKKVIKEIYNEFPFDIVHCHMGYPDNFVGVHIKKVYKVPLVTTIRSTDTDISIKKSKVKNLLKKSLSHSNQIISPSIQLMKKLYTKLGYNSIHIGNGIDPNYLDRVIVNNENNNLTKDKKIILSISNLMESKGIQYNIKAISKLIDYYPNILYLVIGDGPYKASLVELTRKLNLTEHVKFLGELSHEDAMSYLKLCDVFSMPSYRETFGLVYLEAMYYKKPVILCENQALDGTVIHKESGMTVPQHSIDPIVDSVNELLFNEELYRSIVENGYKLVMEHFVWEKIGIKLKEIYGEILNNYHA